MEIGAQVALSCIPVPGMKTLGKVDGGIQPGGSSLASGKTTTTLPDQPAFLEKLQLKSDEVPEGNAFNDNYISHKGDQEYVRMDGQTYLSSTRGESRYVVKPGG